jgi:hypothetical protein
MRRYLEEEDESEECLEEKTSTVRRCLHEGK